MASEMRRCSVAQLVQASGIIVVANQSCGMTTLLSAMYAQEPDQFVLRACPKDVHDLNKQYRDHDELADQIRSGNTHHLHMQSTVYVDNEGECELSPNVFSAIKHPDLPLRAIRAGFLPHELGGDTWWAAIDVVDYVIMPRITAMQKVQGFPVLTLDMITDLPDNSYIVMRSNAWREEDVFWLHLERVE